MIDLKLSNSMRIILVFLVTLSSIIAANAQENFERIYRLDRSELRVKINEVTNKGVTYFELGAPDILKSIRLSAVWKIVYSDGREEAFNEPLPEEISNPELADTPTVTDSLRNSRGPEDPVSNPKGINKKKLNENKILFFVDNRPIYAIHVGISPQILVNDPAFVSVIPDRGLGFRFGYVAEIGFEFNIHQLIGLSLTSGLAQSVTKLSFLPDGEELKDQTLTLQTIPTSLKLKFYPMDGLYLAAGPVLNSLSLSGNEDLITKSRKLGYTLGVGRLSSIGRKKNLFEVSVNYTQVGLNEPVTLGFDSSINNSPILGPYEFKKLVYVNLKFAFQFGVFTN